MVQLLGRVRLATQRCRHVRCDHFTQAAQRTLGPHLQLGGAFNTLPKSFRAYFHGDLPLEQAVDAFGEQRNGLGVAGRLSAELYLSGVGIEPRGVFLGSYALGVYVEAGARQLGPDVGTLQVSGGITIRTPLVWTWGRY